MYSVATFSFQIKNRERVEKDINNFLGEVHTIIDTKQTSTNWLVDGEAIPFTVITFIYVHGSHGHEYEEFLKRK